jgi:hypothetical protein
MKFRHLKRQRGSVSLLYVLNMVGFLVALLSGIDVMRWSIAEARLQSALDSAVLAAGKNLANLPSSPTAAQLAAWQTYAQSYFSTNMPSGYLGSTLNATPTITLSTSVATASTPSTQTVTMSVSGTMPLLVSGYIASVPLKLSASNQALRVLQTNLELVLVLDNTGSMADSASGGWGGSSKLSALKSAAKTLIATLTASSSSGGSVYIGLVPFTTTVNVRDANGNRPSSWLRQVSDVAGNTLPATAPFASAGSSSTAWNGCLAEPHSSSGKLNNPPVVLSPADRPFSAYFDDWNVSGGWQGWGWWGQYWTPLTYSGFTQDWCIAAPTQFLTSNVTTLNSALSSMTASGNTFIATGILWAWRMLSPSWRSSSTAQGWGSATLPADANSNLIKAIIIITDGENTTSTANMYSIPDISQMTLSGSNYVSNNSSNELSQFYSSGYTGRLQPYGSVSTSTEDAIQLATCSAAKAQGIKIWAIVYGSDSGTSHSLSVLQQCVSEAAYYAPSDSDLQADFQSIAGQLSILRLTK